MSDLAIFDRDIASVILSYCPSTVTIEEAIVCDKSLDSLLERLRMLKDSGEYITKYHHLTMNRLYNIMNGGRFLTRADQIKY